AAFADQPQQFITADDSRKVVRVADAAHGGLPSRMHSIEVGPTACDQRAKADFDKRTNSADRDGDAARASRRNERIDRSASLVEIRPP
ncbi:MAG: hypothetical protein ACRC1K_17010, partial [Planctomycetia bacterium]